MPRASAAPAVAAELLTLTNLLAEPDPPVRFRIDRWQPVESRVIFSAVVTGDLRRP